MDDISETSLPPAMEAAVIACWDQPPLTAIRVTQSRAARKPCERRSIAEKHGVIVEDVPVPEIGEGEVFNSRGGVRNLRHGH